MYEYCQNIDEIKGGVSGFVTEDLHCQKPSRGPTEQGAIQQDLFGYAPLAAPCTAFVFAVNYKGEKIDEQKIN